MIRVTGIGCALFQGHSLVQCLTGVETHNGSICYTKKYIKDIMLYP